MKSEKRQHSALIYLLKGLMPYTRQNLLLVYKPGRFFYELERESGYPKESLRRTYLRAEKRGLVAIDTDGLVKLSLAARQKAEPYVANVLPNGARLMVIFDIPERYAAKRQALRLVLRRLGFEQVQLSVWMTDKDYREVMAETIKELEIGEWAKLYEAAPVA